MKLSEWLAPDDIAILHTAIYYGLPAFGHTNCYEGIEPSQHPLRHVTITEPDIENKRCIECGKRLIPTKLPDDYSIKREWDTFYLLFQGKPTGDDFINEFAARVFCWRQYGQII